MGTWRRIETDRDDPKKSTDTFEINKASAKGKPKSKIGNKVSVHLCPHAAGESLDEWYNCKDAPQAQYEEV